MTCTANALFGAEISWKKASSVLSTGGIFVVGAPTYSNDSTNFKVAMTLEITATASTVLETFQICMLTASSQSLAECKQSYECSAVNGGVSSSSKSSTTEVTVTGFQGERDLIFFKEFFLLRLFVLILIYGSCYLFIL